MVPAVLAEALSEVGAVVRSMVRRPALALTVVGLLGAGSGITVTLLSLINSALYRPWQIPDPSSMVIVHPQRAATEVVGALSVAEYRHIREHSASLAPIAWALGPPRATDASGTAIPIRSAFVSADYFRALHVPMFAGRDFHADDEDYGAPTSVAVIAHRLWQSRFASDPGAVGRTLRVGATDVTIIGIAAPGFADVHRRTLRTDLWMPLPAQALVRPGADSSRRFTDARGLNVDLLAGRLRPGHTVASAALEVDRLSRAFRADAGIPSGGVLLTDTRPLRLAESAAIRRLASTHLPLLLGALLVLLTACANASHLFLARTISRQREFAILMALGASRGRILRQIVLESAVLSAVAGSIGMLVAFLAPKVLVASGLLFGADGFIIMRQAQDVRASFYRPDALVLAGALVITGLTTLVASALPCLWVRSHVLPTIRQTDRSVSGIPGHWRTVLLSVQLAVTVVLLLGATLLTRAVSGALDLRPGFAIRDVEVVSVDPQLPSGSAASRRSRFFQALAAELQPAGTAALGWSQFPPMWEQPTMIMARKPEDPDRAIHRILFRPVSHGYFLAQGIDIIKGVVSEDWDGREVILNEAAARLLWPGADPIGRAVESAVSPTEFETLRVRAVVRSTPVRWINEIEPVAYRPVNWDSPWPAFVLERGGDGLLKRVQRIATSLEPTATTETRPMTAYVAATLTMPRIASRSAWALGLLGLLLASFGVAGAFTELVERRRREIGVRMALGARPSQIAALVFHAASVPFAVGCAAGAVLAVLLSPTLNRFLYGLTPLDAVAHVQVAGLLLAATGLAIWIPARRAMRIGPAAALKAD